MRLVDKRGAQRAATRSGRPSGRRTATPTGASTIARLVTHGRPPSTVPRAERMLYAALGSRWPSGARSRFLLLPGGFVQGYCKRNRDVRSGWDSRPQDIVPFVAEARLIVQRLLSARVREQARGKVDAVVVGVDVWDPNGTYAELVALVGVATRSVHFTGKSLPRSDQPLVVRMMDLETHFVSSVGERVLLLGCHDLNLFSPRGRSRQTEGGCIHLLREEMDTQVLRHKPTVVLQLPHGTDTPTTWRASWNALRAFAPTVKAWASSISYFNIYDEPLRAPLEKVLGGTACDAGSLDLVFD